MRPSLLEFVEIGYSIGYGDGPNLLEISNAGLYFEQHDIIAGRNDLSGVILAVPNLGVNATDLLPVH
jgi:hypothetical protein